MIGQGAVFGASMRGLAMNTVALGSEEFPIFKEFWVRQPGPRDKGITVWALMDSTNATGAFEYVLAPGVTTLVKTRVALFWRNPVKEVGFAPLTSMFLHDDNGRSVHTDFRPEVHDSDGLLMHTGKGEWIWRPLESGKMLRVDAYQDVRPRGFGLLQRNRNFERYQDMVARFEMRPSVWVEPEGDWGVGQVELLQLPTAIEYTDNVIAFWKPRTIPAAGTETDLSYNVRWTTKAVGDPQLGYVLATRIGQVPTASSNVPNIRFVVDFGGPAMSALSVKEQVDAEVELGAGVRHIADTVRKNEINGSWRLVVEISHLTQAGNLRARLKREGRVISETWAYTWQP